MYRKKADARMNIIYILFFTAAVSGAGYHLLSKSLSTDINPFASLMVTYCVAMVVCGILAFITKGNRLLFNLIQDLNWASYLIGLCVAGLEISIIFLYRNGAIASEVSLIICILQTIILIPVGILLFHDDFSVAKLLGAVLCMGGIYLLTK